ncbi:MAG: ribose 5-phosphate isomerase B [Candidatus Marinimicrobia bacterium]|nr:ribose 5-phosphate isomerase B [Candidatus Neomarinimicrobiota bacterium]|tara:strand:+ start:523 stop:957 length:435 start_codon:yes stop_codon:yes gene_type:complete
MNEKIAIGCDHAAFNEKEKLKLYLVEKGYNLVDVGTNSLDSVDYPSYGHKVGLLVSNNTVDKGIVICGSGIGISIAANKVKGARAALCTSQAHAEMSRKHNDANILALGARMTEYTEIINIVETWLKTKFEGGRHLKRIKLIEI